MQPIRIPGVGDIQVEQIVGAIVGVLALIGLIIGVSTGSSEGGSSDSGNAQASTSRPAPKPTPSPSTTVTKPSEVQTTSEVAPIPTTTAPTETESPENRFGPGKKYSWRTLYQLDAQRMKLNASRLDNNKDRYLLRGGASPRTGLENYVIGEANKLQTLEFDETAENADVVARLEYQDETAEKPTIVEVERLAIPLVMNEDVNPWAEIQAPDLKGLVYGTNVRYDDNYFYIFTAFRTNELPF